jgi:hypothetical protein
MRARAALQALLQGPARPSSCSSVSRARASPLPPSLGQLRDDGGRARGHHRHGRGEGGLARRARPTRPAREGRSAPERAGAEALCRHRCRHGRVLERVGGRRRGRRRPAVAAETRIPSDAEIKRELAAFRDHLEGIDPRKGARAYIDEDGRAVLPANSRPHVPPPPLAPVRLRASRSASSLYRGRPRRTERRTNGDRPPGLLIVQQHSLCPPARFDCPSEVAQRLRAVRGVRVRLVHSPSSGATRCLPLH